MPKKHICSLQQVVEVSGMKSAKECANNIVFNNFQDEKKSFSNSRKRSAVETPTMSSKAKIIKQEPSFTVNISCGNVGDDVLLENVVRKEDKIQHVDLL